MNKQQYNRLQNLLAQYSRTDAALKKAEATIEERQLRAATSLIPRHAGYKMLLSELEATLGKIAVELEAELFPDPDKRSHKTPFGTLQYHKSTSIAPDDEEKTILKIKVECDQEAVRARAANQPPRFHALQFLRCTEELDLESLAKLDDATLALFGLTRKHKDNFKVVPFKMKADKPAKAADKAKAPDQAEAA